MNAGYTTSPGNSRWPSPDETGQFACNGSNGKRFWFASGDHPPVALTEPGLHLPGDLANRLTHCLNRRQLGAQCEQGSGSSRQLRSARCGRARRWRPSRSARGPALVMAEPARGSAPSDGVGPRMFRWHQAKIGHEVACIDEAGWISHGGSGCCDGVEAPHRTQPLHQGKQRGAIRCPGSQGGSWMRSRIALRTGDKGFSGFPQSSGVHNTNSQPRLRCSPELTHCLPTEHHSRRLRPETADR